MSRRPKLSIISAVDDHPPDLDEFFGALGSQSIPPEDYEVLVVDATRRHEYGPAHQRFLASGCPQKNVTYHRIGKGGRAKALNFGLEQSSGEIVLFLGHDYIVTPEFARAHLAFHARRPKRYYVGVGAGLLPPELKREHFPRWLEASGELYGIPFSEDMTSVPEDFFYIGNASVKREFLREAGVFDEAYAHHAWDDYEMGLRLRAAGMKAVYIPDARAKHVHRIDLAGRCQSMRQAGEAAVVFERRYPLPRPWQAKRAVPPWWHRLAGFLWRAGFLASRREAWLVAYYRAMIAAAFSEGYRAARGAATHTGAGMGSAGGSPPWGRGEEPLPSRDEEAPRPRRKT